MVCLGNICRSPLAEGILRHQAAEAGLDWEIDSAGTSGHDPGGPPHQFSQKVAAGKGIDISAQQCRQFTKNDFDHFDLIYVMDRDNYEAVKRIAGEKWNADRVRFLLDELHPGKEEEVPDPWYGGESGYHHVYDLIYQACAQLIHRYQTSPSNYTHTSSRL